MIGYGSVAGIVRLVSWRAKNQQLQMINLKQHKMLEAEEGLSKAEFFEKYGFVLLDAKSAMTAEDWVASERDVKGVLKDVNNRSVDGGAAYRKRMDDFRNQDTPVKRIYAKEAEDIC